MHSCRVALVDTSSLLGSPETILIVFFEEGPAMCLTNQAMFLFISLLSPEIITLSPSQILIDAEVGPVTWLRTEEIWCMQDTYAAK